MHEVSVYTCNPFLHKSGHGFVGICLVVLLEEVGTSLQCVYRQP